MCGICGYFGEGSPATLESMSRTIGHRGPDGSGIVVGDGYALAHRRLSIIDIEGGHQPMETPEGDALVFNGEIYNFQELRSELEGRGCRFTTRSDSEVLLHACREWGEGCLERLRGMYAFAYWDSSKRRLFLARDRVGIKPLYYTEHRGVFYFASEIKALLELPDFPRRLNRRQLPLYLTFRYVPGEETLFEGIYKLLPGHQMMIDGKSAPKPRRYWQLSFEPDDGPTEEQWKERFWGTFSEAVQLRKISDVPLGAYLSGGLDSSLIVAAMSEGADHPVETFSVGFESAKHDETPYARLVAEHCATRHHELYAEEESAGILNEVIYHLDEPLADLAAIPTYLMARETKPHVTVVLSGEGADEILAGYPKYRAFLLGRKLSNFFPSFLGGVMGGMGPLDLQRALASVSEKNLTKSYCNLAAVFNARELKGLLLDWSSDDDEYIHDFTKPYFNPEYDGLTQLLNLDFHTWLPDDLLLKNDKMTMAHGVEARVPYLDHELVELCAQIPSRYKLRWDQEKVLLRKVMHGRLPKEICRRKKTGFTVPLSRWYGQEGFGSRIDHALSKEFVGQQGLFRSDSVAALRSKPLDHRFYRRQIWSLAALGMWQERFEVGTSQP